MPKIYKTKHEEGIHPTQITYSAYDTPLAIFIGDIHLSLKTPAFRSTEKNWMGRQEDRFIELHKLHDRLCNDYQVKSVPVICVGDIFDRPDNSSELVNFAIRCFRGFDLHTIAGNHDLLHHNLDDIRRSSYWTLNEALDCHMSGVTQFEKFHVSPYSFSEEFKDKGLTKEFTGTRVAIAHSFIYNNKEDPEFMYIKKGYMEEYSKFLQNFEVAVFGDNHKPFLERVGKCEVCNVGTFYRRKRNEFKYDVKWNVLMSNRGFRQYKIEDSENDLFNLEGKEKVEAREESEEELMEFLRSLEKAGNLSRVFDFYDACRKEAKKRFPDLDLQNQLKQLFLR
jgi:predicted phosphodiesterase